MLGTSLISFMSCFTASDSSCWYKFHPHSGIFYSYSLSILHLLFFSDFRR